MDATETGRKSDALEHQDCVIESAIGVFNTTCGIEITPQEDGPDLGADGVILAVISLVGELEWSIFLGLPRATAASVAAKFAGFEIPFDSPDMGDAIGEMTNIFAGEVKMALDRRKVLVEISLPSVMRAKNFEVLVQRNTATRKTCFSSPLGSLWTGVAAGGGLGFVL